MKIACISTSQVPSRTANSIQMVKTSHAMTQLGHEVMLYVPGQFTGGIDIRAHYGLQGNIPIVWVPENRRFKRYDFSWRAVTAARKWGCDLIYTWTPQAALLSRMRNTPTILEMHDRATGLMGPWIVKRYLQSGGQSLLVCVTRALRHALQEQLKLVIPDARVVIAPNGVDLERYRDLPEAAKARAKLGLAEQPTASYTGHFYAGRGLDILYHLAQSFPEVQFLWVGGRNAELDGVKQELVQRKLRNVILTGFIENQQLPLYQAASDVLLMPYEKAIAGSSGGNSADICSPMKMFEYMAAGRVILTSDLPVIREVLDENMAVFCPPDDKIAWQEAFARAIRIGNNNQMGCNARERSADFDILARQRKILAGISGAAL